jgi:hypothetical protein
MAVRTSDLKLILYYCEGKYSGDQINKNEMGGVCSMYREQERCVQGFGGETLWRETTLKT